MSDDDDNGRLELTQNKDVETPAEKKAHERRIHRLSTARWVIWGGMIAVVVLVIFAFYGGEKNGDAEVLRDAINTLATIITLALGFIAGSNIE